MTDRTTSQKGTEMSLPDHPAIHAYLRELNDQLSELDAADRAEVLAGLREHLHDALGPHPDEGQVQAVLGEVGSPDEVAREAYIQRPVQPQHGAGAGRAVPPADRPWAPVTVGLLGAIGILMMILVGGAALAFVAVEHTSPAPGTDVAVSVTYTSALPMVAAAFLIVVPLWAPMVLIAALSGLWRRAEKTVLMLTLPAVALVFGLLPDLGWLLAGQSGVNAGAWAALVLAVGGGGALLWWLCGRGLARARSLQGR